MKEEDNILRKVGTGNPFQVPDGYFENFTSEVMQRLPEKEKPAFVMKEPTLWDKVKPMDLHGSHVCRGGSDYTRGFRRQAEGCGGRATGRRSGGHGRTV